MVSRDRAAGPWGCPGHVLPHLYQRERSQRHQSDRTGARGLPPTAAAVPRRLLPLRGSGRPPTQLRLPPPLPCMQPTSSRP